MIRHSVLALALIASLVVVFTRPPLAQDPAYHVMADQRTLLGIPNCLNVLSSLPFAAVGLLGLAIVFRRGAELFHDPWERWPYAALFAGTTLTAFGSAYYHLAPDNGRLVWDRLPMTVGFMGLLTAVIAERISPRLGRLLLTPLLALGAISVLFWYWSELHDRGDLRLYALVQFGSLLLIVMLMILYPARYPGAAYLFASLALYAAAKWFELADRRIFALGEIVSGHTLKHLTAAAAVGCIVAMLRTRARVRIRVATTRDVASIQTVARQSWSDLYEGIIPHHIQAQALETWYSADSLRESIEANESIFLVADAHHTVLGFMQLMPRPGEVIELGRVYVNPQQQRRGIGSQLLHSALSRAADRGFSKVRVVVEERNQKGRTFYERHDFMPIEKTSTSLFGHLVPVVAYQRIIGSSG